MATTFRRIMLPVDFSVHCDSAAAYATWFARTCRATVHLVHVIANPLDPIYEPKEAVRWLLVEHSEKQADALLRAAAERSVPRDCRRELHIFHGDPYEKLIQAAKQIQPDVIVMSTHGRGGVAHLLIGSVAEKVVRHAPCPVFVIRREPKERRPTAAENARNRK